MTSSRRYSSRDTRGHPYRMSDSKSDSKSEPKSQTDLFIEAAIQCADDVKEAIEAAGKIKGYADWSDQEKITHLTKDTACNMFYVRFPLIARYMICLGIFSRNAFKRFLQKYCEVTAKGKKADGAKSPEERIIMLQARYVQYLWEEKQWERKQTFTHSQARTVYSDALRMLRQETDEFKANYDKIKEHLAEAKKKADSERAKELLTRLTRNEQTLGDESLRRLYDALKAGVDHKEM